MSAERHIFTLTGNLLAERTLEYADWAPGRTQRARAESFQVGGKGINVTKMLTRLGVPSTALCFTGGAPGGECETWLRERGLPHRAFATRGATRVGTVVRSASRPETTFLGPDVAPDREALRACAEFLDAQADGQVLAICGSLPGWTGADFEPLHTALDRWLARGTLVVDTYGPPLAWFLERPIALLKINAEELATIAGLKPGELPAKIARIIITDGPRPIRLRETDGSLATLSPPVVREVSPVGSGDVLFACVLEAIYRRGLKLREAVAYALPHAAANAAHPGVAEFPEP